MRTPEHRAHPRAGKKFETDLNMHYLAPGAFTVLPLDMDRLPDPPPAPPPYRLPTTTRRHRHQSFAIIGEISSSNPNSGSSSPSGRVSPFKGHGFNPTGSRHASPSVSPIPPEDPRTVSPIPAKNNHQNSRIPKPAPVGRTRKSSTGAIFGEKVSHVSFTELNRQASQSLTSLEERQVRSRRPPPSPRKKLKAPPAFKQLSPIQGSSPEPSQSLSSPSRIPTKSKSTPPSRLTSPSRSRAPSRSQSKTNLIKSRDPSPLTSPTKIPLKKYQHVQSKINSFNKTSPRPPTSSDVSEDSESPKKKVLSRKNSFNRTSSRPNLLPKTFMGSKHQNYTSDSSVSTDAVDKSKTLSSTKGSTKVNSITNNVANKVTKPASTTVSSAKPAVSNNIQSKPVGKTSGTITNAADNNNSLLTPKVQPKNDNNNKKKPSGLESPAIKPARKEDKAAAATAAESLEDKGSISTKKVDPASLESDDVLPSAMNVVSSTTNTVAKPLKIETPKLGRSTKPVSPMIDGRVLSATSVSQAINKMNDTVLNTQTLIKDSGLQSRLTPAASAIVAVKSDTNDKKTTNNKVEQTADTKPDTNKKVDGKPPNDDKTAKVAPNNVNIIPPISQPFPSNNHTTTTTTITTTTNTNHNHMASIGLGNAKAIEREVQNNMNKLLGSMDSSLGGTPVNKLSANERIREARTVIAADVKPIRITVKEKPSEVEVQSGNVGPHFSVANGIMERPSLQQQQSPPNEPAKDDPPPNRCKRFLDSCTKALTCNRCQRCRRNISEMQEVTEEEEEEGKLKSGCFKCFSKKGKMDTRDHVRINIEDENGVEQKTSFWQQLNCCKKNKVGDTQSCFPLGKRKESWVERKEGSFLKSEVQQRTKCCSKDGCKTFFRKIFCCCCKQKKEEPMPPLTERKESMVSSKKKSLTPTSVPPPEDTTPKIDASLVEHTSHMKGAIPVLPVWLAWFCCVMNCIGPGTGTVLSGLFCLCIGKPRFSQKDGPKPRIGAFIIDLIIGFSQFFTVLFCLVGWGWSIWWGVIMVKVAKRHKKLKHLEKLEENAAKPQSLAGHHKKDVERGRT